VVNHIGPSSTFKLDFDIETFDVGKVEPGSYPDGVDNHLAIIFHVILWNAILAEARPGNVFSSLWKRILSFRFERLADSQRRGDNRGMCARDAKNCRDTCESGKTALDCP